MKEINTKDTNAVQGGNGAVAILAVLAALFPTGCGGYQKDNKGDDRK